MKKVPNLRFKEFSGEWESKRLEDITEYVDYRGKTPAKSESGIFLVTAKNIKKGYIDYKASEEFISSTSYEEVMRRGIPKIGDVLLTTEAPLGNVAQIDREGIALAQRVIKFRGKKGLNNTYLKYLFLSEEFQKKLYIKAIGTTVLGIQGKVLHKLTISFPSIDEQEKIASFFSLIDKKIKLQTEKVEELKNYKKGLMQKIFLQELRFKDDNGNEYPEWEEKKLGQICEITTGKLDANTMVENGKYRFYTCAKEFYKIDEYAFDTEALLISGNGANVGYIHYYNGKFNAYQRTYVLTNFKENILFIKFYLNQHLKRRILEGKNEGNTPYIVLGTLNDMILKLPFYEEQQKIASFFSLIDKKLELEMEKLEQLQEYKKGLLQQMFI